MTLYNLKHKNWFKYVIISIITLSAIFLSDFTFSDEIADQIPLAENSSFLYGIVVSLITAFLILPFQSIYHWINSRLVHLYRLVRSGQCSFVGKWLAIYTLPGDRMPRHETVTTYVSMDKEVRGTIEAWKTEKKYKFVGKIIGNEMVAHYWTPKHGEKDSGSFKIILDNHGRIAEGNLIYYDSISKKDKKTDYKWRKWNRKYYGIFRSRNIRIDTSQIHDQGVISKVLYKENEMVGVLSKKHVNKQGKHTLEVNGKHYLIKKPWCYLNHSCNPNAAVKLVDNKLNIIAIKEIFPEDEITFDYRKYETLVSKEFNCSCSECKKSSSPYVFQQQQ